MRAVRLCSTVQESWLWLWFRAWCVIGEWLGGGTCRGQLSQSCLVKLGCWLYSLIIIVLYQDQMTIKCRQQLRLTPTTFPHGILLFSQLPVYLQCLIAGIRQQNQEQSSRPPSCHSATTLRLAQCRPRCPPRPSPAV